MVDCRSLRRDFPEISEGGLVFLDSAASSLKPRSVIDSMRVFMENSYANVHRGAYRVSLEASRAYEGAHEIVAKFIGAWSWEEVVFTRNTTESIQLLALTLYYNKLIGRGDEIVVTEAEHHSNILPWVRIARIAGARVKMVPVDGEGVPRWDMLGEILSEKTRVVAFGHASNVTGYLSDARRVAREAHRVGALVVLDGAQSVPHVKVDVRELEADFIAFSGHKMLGPSGIGVLWGKLDFLENLEPPLGGGGTVKRVRLEGGDVKISWEDPPWKFESGTPPIVEAVGLAKAVEYLENIGMHKVEEHERSLTEYTMKTLEELGDHIRILGPKDPSRKLGIVSFTVGTIDPSLIGAWLDSYNIAVRTGLHCAHILHDKLGASQGSVRASFYIYNCRDDVDKLRNSLEELVKTMEK
ncbi:MAG: aminotransferase class V-fold PLP-dependent enzyme [Acidilobaceae archaeon]